MKYSIPIENWGLLYSEPFIHTFTFNGSTIKYYLNETEIEGELETNNFYGTIRDNNMILNNYISNDYDFNSAQKFNKIMFFNECLSQDKVQNIVKTVAY